MNRILLCALLTIASVSYAEQETAQEKNLRLLVELITGEFNNHNQIYFQNNDFLEVPPGTDYSRLHHQRERINADNLDGIWVYSQINRVDRSGEIYRQSYSEFFIDDNGQLVSRSYQLVDGSGSKKAKVYPGKERLSSLTRNQLKASFSEGCDTKWRREIDQFIGITDFNACVIDSKYKDEKRLLFSEEIVAKSGIWGREGAYTQDGKLAFGLEAPNYYRYQRARSMNCQALVYEGEDEGEEEQKLYDNLDTHDIGGLVVFGEERQYRVQLQQVVYPATNMADKFQLSLYFLGEQEAVATASAEPGANQINLRTDQVAVNCQLAE